MLLHAMFGAGCFWGVESTFRKIPGVVDVAVGYSGGHLKNPTYQQVCTDKTGHAEVVWIEYNPEKVTYAQLLDVFFANHNPTTLNRQGPDVGTQYRSVIFYYDDEQKAQALAAKEKIKKAVTQIEPASTFYRAEEYHQRYFEKNGGHCGI
jgi:peptide-methionine (S)-S-oxide reductase